MATHVLRGRGSRNRANARGLLRGRPGNIKRVPPVPWLGEISRYLYPTAITDYESVADANWSTGNFKEIFNGWNATPQFIGTEYSCYYHTVTVSDESTDDVEVVMQPLRYAFDSAAAEDDDFDYWSEPASFPTDTIFHDVNAWQPLSCDGLLPVSGDSHVSDGKPFLAWIREVFDGGCWLHIWRLHGGWNPTTNNTPLPICTNWEVSPRYLRIRKNGTAVGGLFDFEPWLAYFRRQRFVPSVTDALAGQIISSFYLYFATHPSVGASPFSLLNPGTELTFTAGDEIEFDVWYQLRSRPYYNGGVLLQPSQSRNLVAAVTRHVMTTEERRASQAVLTTKNHGVGGIVNNRLHKAATFSGLKIADGFNPAAHTYTFAATGGTWNFGDGSPGAHKAEAGDGWSAPDINSQRLGWVRAAGSGGGGGDPVVFDATYTPLGGGFNRLDFDVTSVAVGSVIEFQFAGGGALFSYTSTTISPSTFVSDLETAMNSFIASQGADGYWSTATATAFSSVLTVDYSSAIGDLVPDSPSAGPLDDFAVSVILDWIHEIAMLTVQINSTPAKYWRFRPADSGDYVQDVTDRREGSLTASPCGVFNHLGTTTFLPWFGTRDPGEADPTDSDRPTSIEVVKVNQ